MHLLKPNINNNKSWGPVANCDMSFSKLDRCLVRFARIYFKLRSVHYASTGYRNIFTILPALAVGCTGKG